MTLVWWEYEDACKNVSIPGHLLFTEETYNTAVRLWGGGLRKGLHECVEQERVNIVVD